MLAPCILIIFNNHNIVVRAAHPPLSSLDTSLAIRLSDLRSLVVYPPFRVIFKINTLLVSLPQ